MDITYIALTVVLLCLAVISAILLINQSGDTQNNGQAIDGDQRQLKHALVGTTANVGKTSRTRRAGPLALKKASPIRSTQALERKDSLAIKPNKVSSVRMPWGW